MIYFTQAEGVGHIKIGFTDKNDAAFRVAELQVGCPVKLILLGVMDGDRQTELELHRKFSAYCIHGEWFKSAPALMKLIGGEKPREPIRLETKHVEIKALTINSKQVTLAFFRQLPEEDIIDWQHMRQLLHQKCPDDASVETETWERGTPWGRVRYLVEDQPSSNYYLVWERDGKLFRQYTPEFFPSKIREQVFGVGQLLPGEREDWQFLRGLWLVCRDRWDKLDQLFVGV